jgi:hypothetical protein
VSDTPGSASAEHFKALGPEAGPTPHRRASLNSSTAVAELWLAVLRAAPQSEEKPAGDTTL